MRSKKPARGRKASNKTIKNPNGHTENALGHENNVTVNVFNNLRQALHEKVLAKENMSLGLNSPIRQNGKNVEHLTDVMIKNTTKNLEKSNSDNSLKTETTTGSVEHHQRTSPKEKMASSIDKKKQDHVNISLKKISGNSSNASTSMSARSQTSNSSSADITSITKGGQLNNSAIVNVSNLVIKGKILTTDEGELRGHSLIIFKPNTTDSGVDERTTRQNQNKLEYFGKDVNGTKQMLATSGANNVSNADNNRRTDGVVASGNGLEADDYSMGSANDFETSTSVSGDHDDSDDTNIHEHIKVFLGAENTESSTNDLGKYEVIKGLPSMALSSVEEGSTSVGDVLYKTSSLTNVNAESDEADTTSGSMFETLSQEAGSGLHFGGEGTKGLPSMDLSSVEEGSTTVVSGLYKTSLLTNVNAESDTATTSDSEEFGSGLHFGGKVIKGLPSMDLSPAESSTTVDGGLYKTSSSIKVNTESDEAETTSGSDESGRGLHFGGEVIKGHPSMDSSSAESSTTVGDGLYKTSSSTNVDMESDAAITSGLEESGNGHHFGGEGDNDDALDVEEEMSYSNNRDDINQSGLFPSSRTTSVKQMLKSVGDEQSVEHQNGDFSRGSSPDISQIRYNDWDDVGEAYSGFESGYYESSADELGSGEYGSSSKSLSIDAKASSVKYHTTANTSNFVNSLYRNGGDVDGERKKNEMPSAGEDMSLERRNQIHGSITGNRKRLSEEKRFRIESLRRKSTEKAKDMKNNDFMSSWEDKELQQLLYWLSTNDNQNNRLKQAQKDIWRLHNIHQTLPESTKEYSRIQDMLLQKMFPNFSKRKREEFEERNGNGERTFRADKKNEQIMQRQ